MKKMNTLTNNFVFGTQYHRAPVPLENEWDDDFKKMKDLGYNTVKFWLIWKWVEREAGKYNWATYDNLLEKLDKYKLRAVPNTILEMAPEWVYNKYPEAHLVDSNGVPAQNLVGQAYQLGGFQPDWHCKEARDASYDFLRKAIERYKSHPSILTVNIWNEPCWYFSFGQATVRAFRQWLQNKFITIEQYNEELGQAATSFDEIKPPASAAHFPLGLQYRLFMTDSLCDRMRERSQIIKEVAPDIITSSHAMMPILNHNANEWKQASTVDFYGTSAHQTFNKFDHEFSNIHWPEYPMIFDLTRSVSAYGWCTELRSGPQNIGASGEHYTPEDIRHWLFTILAHGMKGILFWQFKPERIGPEAPECGIITLSGGETERCKEVRDFSKFICQNEGFLLNASPVSSGIGILWGEKQAVMGQLTGESGNSTNLFKESVTGIYRALWTHSVHLDFFDIDTLMQKGNGSELPKVLILPYFMCLDEVQAEYLRQFVKNGGTLIAEGGLGSYDHRSWYSATIPPFGLEEVFGLTEGERVSLDTVDFFVNNGLMATGSKYRRRINVKSAEIIGKFENGEPAVLSNAYGKGTAVYISTHPGINCANHEQTGSLGFWYELIKDRINKEPFAYKAEENVTLRFLQYNGDYLIFAFNRSSCAKDISISFQTNDFSVRGLRGRVRIIKAEIIIDIPSKDISIIKAERR
jgi:beta-galactosidase